MISVICPTVQGREQSYERCKRTYHERTIDEIQFITVHDMPSAGTAWNLGVEEATGDYIHFTADDLEPLEGWDGEARRAADDGILPAPVIYTRDSGQIEPLGTLPDGLFTRIPFCTSQQWQKISPMIPLHYYTDNWFSWKGNQHGLITMEVPSYAFKHHWEMAGRKSNDQMAAEYYEYERYKREGYAG